MFSSRLPWRQSANELARDFPQFDNVLVVAIKAAEPEEGEATAAALADKVAQDHTVITDVARPDASPFLRKEGLLFLDTQALTDLMNRTIDAQPFLGQLVADPSARGLFAALALLGIGVTKENTDLSPYFPALRGFHTAMADALAGHPRPLSWQALLGGGLSDLAGQYRFVLVHPKLNYDALEPGGAATAAIRAAAADLPFVKSGDAQVAITGQVALADEQFATVAEGVAVGLLGSVALITLWLYFAVKTWRLIVPILGTLLLGLALTLFFAAAAVGTLNLISVGFGILFVGIAVDFAIQFSVRFRERRHEFPDLGKQSGQTAARTGVQILVASVATAAGFLAFVPTDFRGVAELGLIAGAGMLIAFGCTLTFLPAAITLLRPPGEKGVVGFAWAVPLDGLVARRRRAILIVFGVVAVIGLALSQGLTFNSNPLDTSNQNTEAMRTLKMLISSPITSPFTTDILAPNTQAATALADKLRPLSTVASVRTIESYIPADQSQKLAIIQDAASILEPTLTAPASAAPVTPDQIRMAAKTALGQIEPAVPKLKPDDPLRAIAEDLRTIGTAPDAAVMAVNASLTRFLPQELDQLRLSLSAEPVTLDSVPTDIKRQWMLSDGRARVQALPKLTDRDTSKGLAAFVRQVTAVAPNAGGPAVTIQAEQCHHRRRVPLGGGICAGGDHADPVRRPSPGPRRGPGAGAAAAVRADDAAGGGAAAAAAELRQHHRATAAARGRRVVQHLLRDELARRPDCGAGLGHRAGDRVLGADHQHGVRIAGTVAPPRHREHGEAAADQPGLHAAGQPGVHSGAAGQHGAADAAMIENRKVAVIMPACNAATRHRR